MKRVSFIHVALVLLLLVTVASERSSGYATSGWKWSTQPVYYYVNPANLDVTGAAAVAAIQSAAAAWTTQSRASFSFSYAGSTNGTTVTNNARNEVFFRNVSSASLATTYYWTSGGRGLDTDIVFWD